MKHKSGAVQRFCVDAPRAHQKWDADSTYIASASWQVVKDYIILLTVLTQLCAKRPLTASTYNYYYELMGKSCPTQMASKKQV